MNEASAERQLVMDGNRTLGVLQLQGAAYQFSAWVPALARLNGYRFRSPEVAIALLRSFAAGTTATASGALSATAPRGIAAAGNRSGRA